MKKILLPLLSVILIAATVNCVFAQAPTLSYTTPANLGLGSSIIISPTSSNIGALGYGNQPVPTFVASGHNRPVDIAKDHQGNIFFVYEDLDAVMELPANGGPVIARGTGYTNPQGVALDADDNLYVTCYDAAGNVPQVIKIAAGSNVTTILAATGFHTIGTVGVDKNGNVYVVDNDVVISGDQHYGYVMKVPAGGGTPVKVFNGMTPTMSDIAVTSTGDVYVVRSTSDISSSLSYLTSGSRITLPGDGFVIAAFTDAFDNIYFSKTISGIGISIYEVHALANWFKSGGAAITTTFSYDEDLLLGFTLDDMGVINALSYDGEDICVFKPKGGYFIDKPLPAGVFFDQYAGVISGTPTQLTPAQDYKITAWNGNGSTSATVSLAVVPPLPELSYTGKHYYKTGDVINILPATYRVVDTAVPFDVTPALPDGLSVDNTTGIISGTITAANTDTTYTITAHNENGITAATLHLALVSSNADLSALMFSAGTLTPVFDKDSLNYTAQIASNIGSISLTPFTADANATITINGNAVASGTASGNIALAAGDNTITIDVLAQDGLTTKTYTLTVNRGLSDNANLALSINPSELLVKYSGGPAKVNYKVSVSAATSEVQLIARRQHPATTVTVDGMTVPGSGKSDPVYLTGDTTYINVTAIAAAGNVRTYSVMVTKTGSNNADATFKINTDNKLVKAATGPANVNYTTVVSNATGTIQIFPISYNPAAIVKIGGTTIPDGFPSAPLPLNPVGPTVINMTVTSETGANTLSYSITVTKTASNNANADFTLSSRSVLSSTTGPSGKNYFTSVTAATSSVTVTPKTEDPNAAITINGLSVANKAASAPIPLTADTTLILISVTAENGVVTKTYSIAVAKNGSNNSLAKISLSNKAILEPYFGSADKNYIALLSPEVSSVGVIVTPQDVTATVYINGVLSPARTPVPVTVEPDVATYVDVEVHAQDSSTVSTYSLILAPVGSGNYNASFKLSPKAELVKVPNIGCGCGEEATYAASVDAATPSIKVTTVARDTAATIYVNGIETANRMASAPITLNDDSATTIIVDVVSEVGLPKTYYIIVNKTGSNLTDAAFVLQPKSELIKTKTGGAQLNYTTTVAAGQTTLKIKPRTVDPNATIVINGNLIARGDTTTVTLNSGITVITGLITAQDGITTKSFSITVSKNGSNNAMAKLKINSGTVLTKTTGYQNYITSVPATSTDIGITPVLEDAGATVTINGLTVTAGAQSVQTLTADTTTYNITVTAQDGITIKTYNLTVLKNGSNVATANFAVNTTSKLIELSSGPAQTNYSLSVSPLAAALVVTPKPSDASATVAINGMPAANGLPSDPITLNPSGPTLVSMLVTAQDGITTHSYSILVSPSGSNIADLTISLAPKTALVKVAGAAAGNYQATVAANLRVVSVKIQRADTNAVVTINGAPASTATSGTRVTLTGDTTMVNITSVAEDGVSTKVYTIALIRNASMRAFAATPGNKNDVIANASTKLLTPTTEVTNATKGVTVYPNPFVNELKIDLKGYNAKEVQITITTLQARQLFNQTMPVVDNKVELNVSNLKQGIYIINMLVNGERKGYRIVKN